MTGICAPAAATVTSVSLRSLGANRTGKPQKPPGGLAVMPGEEGHPDRPRRLNRCGIWNEGPSGIVQVRGAPKRVAMNLAERVFIGIAVLGGLSLCGAVLMIG